LADRLSHSKLLALGLLVLIVADMMLALGSTWIVIGLGVALWGLHMGITQGLLATMLADAAPPERRGTAFGIFGLLTWLTMLVASALAGWLWARFCSPITFSAGALFCVLGLCGIAFRPGKDRTAESG